MSIPASWFIQILNMSLGAAWAALLVMAGRLLLRRAPKVFSYALWSVVLFRLVCPVSFTSVFSLMPRPQTIPQNIVYAARPEIQSGFTFFDQAVNQSLPPAAPAASINPVQLWLEVGNLVWQAGALLMFLYCVLSYLRFCRQLREATRREGNVWESDRIPTAFVLGFFRPRIYLPLGLGEEEREYILCHEETHIRRMDHLVKPLALLLLCVHWFNPVLWLTYFLMCRDMEMSCDEAVMEKLGSGIRKGYSSSLLAVSARQSGLMSPLAFGENDVKTRIRNILRYKKPAFWVLMAALVLGVILAFCLLTDPAEGWIPLSDKAAYPQYNGLSAESIRVERRDAGAVLLTDAEQVERLVELVSGLEVNKKPLPSEEKPEDWELRLTFQRSDAGGSEDLSLCFTLSAVWEEGGPSYPLRESIHLFRVVEEYTFLTDPEQAGEYRVSFLEVLDGREQQYLISTEPLVGSRLASLLLDGTLLEEKPGQVPPSGDYLFINMGNPGTTYYVYESGGRFYLERPEDYRLELTQEVYQEILEVYQTVSRRESPDPENGYYTGFEETVAGERLRKFTGHQGETATRLAELILGGADVPLNPLEKEVPVDSFLRIEIREPGNAYYLYEDQGHYYAEKLMNYRVELTEDAYRQIRNIYLDTAEEGIVNEALSFYAEGEMADIARVGIEGYFGAFTAQNIPEELRIRNFTVGEITPMAGTPEEFAVSFLWDYDTTQASRWISPNGNGQPGADFDGWHWTENYQEFRFRRIQGKLYTVVGLGTGGGGQGLAPIQTADGPSRRAQMALWELFSWTVQQANDYDRAVSQATAGAVPSSGTGMAQGAGDLLDYHTRRFGDVVTEDCIEKLIADRTLNRVVSLARSAGADIDADGVALQRRAGGAEVYDFSATIKTAAGETVATAQGNLTMEQEGTVWKAARIALTVHASTSGGGQATAPTGSGTDPLTMNPDTDPDPNPTSLETQRRRNALVDELYDALPLDAYNQFEVWCEGESILLEIAVTDEAAVDRVLDRWTGTKWNVVRKTEGRCSRARLEEFAQEVNRLNFGPGASKNNARENYGRVDIVVSYDTREATEEAALQKMPAAVSRLMTEMNIPADLVDYGVMAYRSPPAPGVNPDT